MTLSDPAFKSIRADDTWWRLGILGTPELTLAIGLNLSEMHAEMGRVGSGMLIVLPFALLLIGCGGWLIAQRALKPINKLSDAAERITASGLDRRVTLESEDVEFERLIKVFNGMLDRLQRGFEQAMRFSADAAHELKTPLAIIQGELEAAVQAASDCMETREVFGNLLVEVQRLKTITQKLLLLAQADAGKLPLDRLPLDFSRLVQDAVEDAEAMSEGSAAGFRIDADIGEELRTNGDRRLLQQVLHNLISNAIKYNQPESRISVHVGRIDGWLLFTIDNQGPGIPPKARDRIFDRFYRVSDSRNRERDGFGLGLSLSREIARAHGGELSLLSSSPELTRFQLRLPAGEDR